jgi:hypothetical protein
MLTGVAGLAMIGSTWWVRDSFIALPVILGALTYIGVIVLLRVIPSEDWALLRELGQGLLVKVGIRKAQPAGSGHE